MKLAEKTPSSQAKAPQKNNFPMKLSGAGPATKTIANPMKVPARPCSTCSKG